VARAPSPQSAGYPAKWRCNPSTCTWEAVIICDDHPDPDCNSCDNESCMESATGSCAQ
jgi:hypothetical protein